VNDRHGQADVDLMVRADRMVPMSEEGVVDDAAVCVRGGEIVYAGPAAGCASLRAERVIQAGDAVLIPGLVNAHTHVGDHIYGTLVDEADVSESLYEVIFPLAGKLDHELLHAVARVGMWDAIRCGVTTVCDQNMYAEATAQAATEVGIRAVVAEKVVEYRMDSTPSFDRESRTFTMTWDRGEAERLLALGLEFAERWRGHPLVSPAIGPLAADHLSADMLLECARAADSLGIKLVPHIAQTEAEGAEMRRRGYEGSIRYLDAIGFLSPAVHAAHMVFLDDEEIAIAADGGISMSFNPLSMLSCRCFPPIQRELAAGIRSGFGTDAFSMDMLADMRAGIYVANLLGDPHAAPLGAHDLLRMATVEGAQAVGLGDRVGTIEPGKRADLVVLDLRDPRLMQVTNVVESVVYYGSGRNVTHTIVDGKVVYERGEPALFDEDEMLDAGRHSAAEWLRRGRPLIDGSALADRVDQRAYGVA
jgi:5-methylthioadenosine/S-adenosylhomocysteine deaminase